MKKPSLFRVDVGDDTFQGPSFSVSILKFPGCNWNNEPTNHDNYPLLGGGNSNIFSFHPKPWENNPDLTHIFQMGGFNHQLDTLLNSPLLFHGSSLPG